MLYFYKNNFKNIILFNKYFFFFLFSFFLKFVFIILLFSGSARAYVNLSPPILETKVLDHNFYKVLYEADRHINFSVSRFDKNIRGSFENLESLNFNIDMSKETVFEVDSVETYDDKIFYIYIKFIKLNGVAQNYFDSQITFRLDEISDFNMKESLKVYLETLLFPNISSNAYVAPEENAAMIQNHGLYRLNLLKYRVLESPSEFLQDLSDRGTLYNPIQNQRILENQYVIEKFGPSPNIGYELSVHDFNFLKTKKAKANNPFAVMSSFFSLEVLGFSFGGDENTSGNVFELNDELDDEVKNRLSLSEKDIIWRPLFTGRLIEESKQNQYLIDTKDLFYCLPNDNNCLFNTFLNEPSKDLCINGDCFSTLERSITNLKRELSLDPDLFKPTSVFQVDDYLLSQKMTYSRNEDRFIYSVGSLATNTLSESISEEHNHIYSKLRLLKKELPLEGVFLEGHGNTTLLFNDVWSPLLNLTIVLLVDDFTFREKKFNCPELYFCFYPVYINGVRNPLIDKNFKPINDIMPPAFVKIEKAVFKYLNSEQEKNYLPNFNEINEFFEFTSEEEKKCQDDELLANQTLKATPNTRESIGLPLDPEVAVMSGGLGQTEGYSGAHRGQDFKASPRDPNAEVTSPFTGCIIEKGWDDKEHFGNYLILKVVLNEDFNEISVFSPTTLKFLQTDPVGSFKKGEIIYVLFAHFGKKRQSLAHTDPIFNNLRLYQFIKVGDILGLIGNTGLATGPHLHMELKKKDKDIGMGINNNRINWSVANSYEFVDFLSGSYKNEDSGNQWILYDNTINGADFAGSRYFK